MRGDSDKGEVMTKIKLGRRTGEKTGDLRGEARSGGEGEGSGQGILMRAERVTRGDTRCSRRCSPATSSSERSAVAQWRKFPQSVGECAREESAGARLSAKGRLQEPLGDLYRPGRGSGSEDDRESNDHQWPWGWRP
jgi:hypothetical protein